MGGRFCGKEKLVKLIARAKSRVGKNLIQKLKTGIIGASLIGASYFNSFNANAQENYTPKYNTTTHYIIKEIQKENAFVSPKTLDEIIDKSKKIIKENYDGNPYNTEQAKNLMKKINSEIIEKYRELDLDKSQPCYFRSLTYLAIAEKNNLPLYAIGIPDHMFVRWDPDGRHIYAEPNNEYAVLQAMFRGLASQTFTKNTSDKEGLEIKKLNEGDFSWETILSNEVTDQYYFLTHNLSYRDIDNEIFLKNLDKKEIISIAFHQESVTASDKNLYDKALYLINKSIEINPNNHLAYYSKGNDLFSIFEKECLTENDEKNKENKNLSLNCKKYLKKSFESYKKSEELMDIFPCYLLGKVSYYLRDYEEAEHYFTKSVEDCKSLSGKCKNLDGLLKRAKFYSLTNQKDKAEKDYLSILNLEHKKTSLPRKIKGIFKDDEGKVFYANMERLSAPKNIIGTKIDWYNAKKVCENLEDSLNWRLPALNEIKKIYENSEETDFPDNWYWSITEDSISQENALISWGEGVKSIRKKPKSYNEIYYNTSIVCVRVLNEKEKENLFKEFEKNSW